MLFDSKFLIPVICMLSLTFIKYLLQETILLPFHLMIPCLRRTEPVLVALVIAH